MQVQVNEIEIAAAYYSTLQQAGFSVGIKSIFLI